MRSILIHIFIIALLLGFCAGAHADESTPTAGESTLFELINQARENPLAMARLLGMNPEKILAGLPDMGDILMNGLSPLALSADLRAAAAARTAAMLEECCYSVESSDDRTLDRRIADAGYVAVETGESLGIVAFANFIEPEAAARLLFEQMFRDEVDPARTEPRNILNPDLDEIGIVLGTGTLTLGRLSYNIYAVTCDFGFGPDMAELQLMNLINQARANPLETAASLGMDTERLLEDHPLLSEILTEGLPPLAFDARLYGAARGHVFDMLEKEYLSHDSPDGRAYEDRIRDAGYEAVDSGEAVELACRCACEESCETAALFFRRIFTNELEGGLEPGEMTILNPMLEEAGIAVAAGTSALLGGICGDEIILLTADFGSEEGGKVFLSGVTYVDENGNGLYDAGEGTPADIMVEGPDEITYGLRSGATGNFFLSLENVDGRAGQYDITAFMEDGRIFAESVEIDGKSTQVFIGAPAPVQEQRGYVE